MNRILVVLKAEYLRAVRTKAFLIGVLVTPLLFGGGIIAMGVSESSKDTRDRSFALVDRTGRLQSALEGALATRNENEVYEDGEKVAGLWELVPFTEEEQAATGDDLDVLLSKRVDDGDLLGYLEVGADVFSEEGGADDGMEWHTDSPTQDDLPDWLEQVVNTELRAARFAAVDFDAEQARRLNRWVRMRSMGLVERDESGEIEEDTGDDQLASVVVPVGLVFLMFMLVMMSTPALMNNVLEEKMQKIAEVLVSSVLPFDLLMGKLLSAVAMSLTLAVIYVGGLLAFLHSVEDIPPAVLDAVSPGVLASFLLFMLLALFINGSIFSALGSACSEIQDTQTLMMPVMIVLILPMMFLGPIMKSPDGTIAQVLTYIPPATPVVLFLRIHVPPGCELWEILVALALCVLFTIGCVRAGAKIFRIGMLSQGQAPSFRKLLGWIVSE